MSKAKYSSRIHKLIFAGLLLLAIEFVVVENVIFAAQLTNI